MAGGESVVFLGGSYLSYGYNAITIFSQFIDAHTHETCVPIGCKSVPHGVYVSSCGVSTVNAPL